MNSFPGKFEYLFTFLLTLKQKDISWLYFLSNSEPVKHNTPPAESCSVKILAEVPMYDLHK